MFSKRASAFAFGNRDVRAATFLHERRRRAAYQATEDDFMRSKLAQVKPNNAKP
jgi:hypothetical protein